MRSDFISLSFSANHYFGGNLAETNRRNEKLGLVYPQVRLSPPASPAQKQVTAGSLSRDSVYLPGIPHTALA